MVVTVYFAFCPLCILFALHSVCFAEGFPEPPALRFFIDTITILAVFCCAQDEVPVDDDSAGDEEDEEL